MRIFVTGASGFIGQAVTKELLTSGHTVLGLARSPTSAELLTSLGATPHAGSLSDLFSLQAGAAACDAVIHLAFIHDFAHVSASVDTDKRAITAMADALAGSARPLLVTNGTLLLPQGRLATEEERHDASSGAFAARGESEELARGLAARGIRSVVVRLAPVIHGEGDAMFIPTLIATAREKGVAAYVGEGMNRWPATHVHDAAVAYRLAVERGLPAGSTVHIVAEEGVRMRDVAGVIGERLGVEVRGVGGGGGGGVVWGVGRGGCG